MASLISPQTTPQAQKPFAFSPSASTALGSSSVPYAQSPISTPSRVLHYSTLPSSSTTTQSSSTSDFLATPSPVISAYRGKHMSADVGRTLLYISWVLKFSCISRCFRWVIPLTNYAGRHNRRLSCGIALGCPVTMVGQQVK